ncbi:MAG TPA: hypothetical protein VF749_07560, partial [Candidatus Acidoferrum sp.]
FCSGLENTKSSVPAIGFANYKVADLKPMDESGHLAFVSRKMERKLACGGLSCGYAPNKHPGFLNGHSKSQKPAVERCLQPYAGLKQPRNEEILSPLLTLHRFEQARRGCSIDTRCIWRAFYLGSLDHLLGSSGSS